MAGEEGEEEGGGEGKILGAWERLAGQETATNRPVQASAKMVVDRFRYCKRPTMRPFCAANPQERAWCVERNMVTAGNGRRRSSCAKLPESSQSWMACSSSQQKEPGASETASNNPRASPNDEREPSSLQTSRQSSTDVPCSAAHPTDTRKKGSGQQPPLPPHLSPPSLTPASPPPLRQCLPHWG